MEVIYHGLNGKNTEAGSGMGAAEDEAGAQSVHGKGPGGYPPYPGSCPSQVDPPPSPVPLELS